MAILLAYGCPYVCRADDQLSPEKVRIAIQRGAGYLLSIQKNDGSWRDYERTNQPGGATALAALALMSSGYTPRDRAVTKALDFLRETDPESQTYALALHILVYCAAEPRKDLPRLQGLVAQLQSTQITTGKGKGGWNYGRNPNPDSHDPSNTQYALMALHEAERNGISVEDRTWRLAQDYWQRLQLPDGSWKYSDSPQYGPSGSMTCAGIASLIIAHGELEKGTATVDAQGSMQCCGVLEQHPEIERGFDWLARHFSVQKNPGDGGAGGLGWYFYYMYGVERVGRMSGRRFIGDHDWYREGTSRILARQDPLNGSWKGEDVENDIIGTSFAILFLSKGRRPILISKLVSDESEDTNHHQHDLANLTQHVERRWHQDMTWQNIDIKAATVEDLLQSPVLFLCGRDGLQLTSAQKQNLRNYVVGGGFVFANACCGGKGFDKDFRQLMQELFPETRLRFLESDHPIWYAEQTVPDNQIRPLYGLDACCRTGVVYCPEDLSCLWQLGNQRLLDDLPADAREKVLGGLAMGTNVLAYATNRQLRDKLDRINVPNPKSDVPTIPDALRVAQLRHSGGSHEAAAAVGNLLLKLRDYAEVAVRLETPLIEPNDAQLKDLPIIFVHGRRSFEWTSEQRQAIRNYLDKGGFLIANAICASQEFSASFRTEMSHIFPEARLHAVPASHPLFSGEFAGFDGFDVTRAKVRHPTARVAQDEPLRSVTVEEVPTCEAVERGGRMVVLFSPLDLSCAWENHPSIECEGYATEDAVKLGINFVHFAMQQ
ncbi:MAG: DUF4159 domain-containing protein [Planctomycetota bacterium]|nr:DUF4159 domain-containing protein [Planctomycetota bacterium]MDA1177161.1 DUF4159 domain-containing protein [Planctomycetota bacterium]